MVISLSAELPLPGEEPYPPGAVDYFATYNIAWYPGGNEQWESDDETIVSLLAEAANVNSAEERVLIPAGHAHLVVVDSFGDPFGSLDAREADLAYLAEMVYVEGEVHPDLDERLEGFDQYAVLVNNVAVEPAWRELSIGLLGTGTVLSELSRGCRFAALDAIRPGIEDWEERQQSHRRLSTYWGKLGFESWKDRVLVLDLATATLTEALTELTTRAVAGGGSDSLKHK
ncbi:MAG TPA: hypothetical protein VLM05_16315 [Mycobacteriales bacterium]|nr:hypothetical protein [Mycobacteriales bacterium]